MRIMIIKLGALGDVVRTLSILPALRKKYPLAQIYWITKKESLDIFSSNPYVKKVFTLPYQVTDEKFDILYNFDIEEEATYLAAAITSDKKFGFKREFDFPDAYNMPSQYYLNTLFDDELKRKNKKTYQEMMFEAAELKWNHQHCPIYLKEDDLDYAKEFAKKNKLHPEKLIGIHMGAGSRWPSKAWHISNSKELIIKLHAQGNQIILFGGPNEVESQKNLARELLKSHRVNLILNNPKNTIKQFASLVNLCKAMVCSDSLALHISLALKKPTVALFFCTSPDEIEGYGILQKIVSPMLYEFFPHKSDQYSQELVKSISPEQVLKALNSIK
jgi:ADP-heptose:LPS heptosyltransferase